MQKRKSTWFFLLLLILSGEAVFILPFVLPRVFRPTVLEVFQIDNLELGLCFALYGVVALISYLFGGPLADRFPPRKLIACALWLTACGGLLLATFPDFYVLQVLYGFWGFTTIFLFWAPMIKATRVWGGASSQGMAFGLLDGGRGLVGALIGTAGVVIFSALLTEEISQTSLIENQSAFRYVILTCTGFLTLIGFLVWFCLKMDDDLEDTITRDRITWVKIWHVLKYRSVWLMMITVLCAYVGYKITDVFSLYAQDVMLYDQVQSAQVGTFLLFMRPVIGVSIGLLADRMYVTWCLALSFVISFIGALLFATGFIAETTTILFFFSILVVTTGVYAGRSLYFAVMESGRIPLVLTGTAIGLVSAVGFTPDIFAGPVIGYFLDNAPGEEGHQHVFWMLAVFSFLGFIAAGYFHLRYSRQQVGGALREEN